MSDRPQHKHGRTEFFIEGEGFVAPVMQSPRLKAMARDGERHGGRRPARRSRAGPSGSAGCFPRTTNSSRTTPD